MHVCTLLHKASESVCFRYGRKHHGLRLMFVCVGASWGIARGEQSEIMALTCVEYFGKKTMKNL